MAAKFVVYRDFEGIGGTLFMNEGEIKEEMEKFDKAQENETDYVYVETIELDQLGLEAEEALKIACQIDSLAQDAHFWWLFNRIFDLGLKTGLKLAKQQESR